MICFGWKGGIGTASRIVGPATIGVLVLTNFGSAEQLRIGLEPVLVEVVRRPLARPEQEVALEQRPGDEQVAEIVQGR